MSIQKRSIIMATLFVLASVFYGAAKYYAPSVALHVVKQSLIQKAPSGEDSILLQKRLDALLSTTSTPETRMEMLLRISGYLEKVQRLTPEELHELLSIEKQERSPVT
jgi:hypothetical protein